MKIKLVQPIRLLEKLNRSDDDVSIWGQLNSVANSGASKIAN